MPIGRLARASADVATARQYDPVVQLESVFPGDSELARLVRAPGIVP
jgi:hypothetical protein